jgi:LPXTG-site transpeptidase (sortase) family protein
MMSKRGFGYSLGAALLLTGLILGGRTVYELNHMHQTETSQDRAWQQFSVAAQGAAPAASPSASASPTADVSLPDGIFLKMTLPSVSKDAVAVNGDWNSLKTFNTVHYKNSPVPGQKGNMLIAFHREPKWLDINNVKVGDTIRIDGLDRMTYEYKIDFIKVVPATDVSNLKPTTGIDLTLITCDPPWQDYNRMVFRAHMLSRS